ncbi:unnamed protein product [marine sediment metagenome]|uniref:Uncharacterized protein n=1 Tax=marine sediment metagenome TaxID=412755 RepID=X1HCC8_9ZZZZ
MAGEKKLFDNLYKVIKLNSGAISANDVVATEIGDLQIPRGYCARIRKVRFTLRDIKDQVNTEFGFHVLTALVLDADDANENRELAIQRWCEGSDTRSTVFKVELNIGVITKTKKSPKAKRPKPK